MTTRPQIMYRESYEVHDIAAGVDLFFWFLFPFLVEFPGSFWWKMGCLINVPKTTYSLDSGHEASVTSRTT